MESDCTLFVHQNTIPDPAPSCPFSLTCSHSIFASGRIPYTANFSRAIGWYHSWYVESDVSQDTSMFRHYPASPPSFAVVLPVSSPPMPNPGVFCGPRKEFLLDCLDEYKAAVAAGHGSETIAIISRRFFKRWAVDLPLQQEVSPEELSKVNDYSADDERPPLPDLEAVGQDAYDSAVAEEDAYQKLLTTRRNQIRNFLTYRLTKLVSKDGTVSDPYAPIKRKFFGVSTQKPRKRTAHNIWRRSNAEKVEAEVQRKTKGVKIAKHQVLTVYDEVALALFKKLSTEDQEQFKGLAEEEHEEDVKKWKEASKLKVSTEPVDRQRAIEHAAPFMQPILNVLEEVTGWKWHLMGGGPEPADGGRLNVLSIASSGKTSGPVGVSFIQSQRNRYRKVVVPMWGNFLKMCYTPDECRARALAEPELPLAQLGIDEAEVLLDSVDDISSTEHSSPASPPSRAPSPPPENPSRQSASPRGQFPQSQSVPPSRGPSPARQSHPPSRAPSPTRQPLPPRQSPPPSRAPSPTRQSLPPRQSPPPSRAPSPSRQSPPRSPPPPPQQPPPPPSSSHPTSPHQSPAQTVRSLLKAIQLEKRRRKPSTASAPRKKRRSEAVEESTTSSNSPNSPSSLLQPSSNAPQWFTEALSMLQSERMGSGWTQLLSAWKEFEEGAKYQKQPPLSRQARPDAVGDWIQRARIVTFRPPLTAVIEEFFLRNTD
ncbi:hypothetical protein H0H93_015970 [Arthromyces matolae]|nr:hypothetical protein H0H93_015970 [Arthromyces matolae]